MKSDFPSRFFQVLLAILAGTAICGIWFSTAIVFPKAMFLGEDYGADFPPYIQNALSLSPIIFRLIIPISIVTLAVFAFTLIPLPFLRLRDCCRRIFPILTLFLAVLAIAGLCASSIAYIVAGQALHRRHLVYERTLEHFALTENAQANLDRIEDFWRNVERVRVEAQKIGDDLNSPVSSNRIRTLLQLAEKAKSVESQRRLLSSVVPLESRVPHNQSQSKKILDLAKGAGAPEFDSIDELAKWISEQKKKDGWDPILLPEIKD